MAKDILTGTTLENLAAELKGTFAKKTVVQAIDTKVTTLIGGDTGKSVRTIANEELASQLIPANAKESLDTLQEIAAWIQNHPDDAAAMNQAITALQTKLTLGKPAAFVPATGVAVEGTTLQTKLTLGKPAAFVPATGVAVEGTTYYADANGTALDSQPTTGADVSGYYVAGPEYATVKAYVEAAIAALNIGNYALASDLTALAGRVGDLEEVGATKVEASSTNGNIKIDNVETTVYTLPSTVLHDSDIKDYSRAEIAALLADE